VRTPTEMARRWGLRHRPGGDAHAAGRPVSGERPSRLSRALDCLAATGVAAFRRAGRRVAGFLAAFLFDVFLEVVEVFGADLRPFRAGRARREAARFRVGRAVVLFPRERALRLAITRPFGRSQS
jgi:hypothetical protein